MRVKTTEKARQYRKVLLLFAVLLLTGCGVSRVVIEGSFPTPNVSKLPLTIAVYYDPALRDYAYIEYSETGREEFNIESGESHIQLFNAMLPAMFDKVVIIESMEEAKIRGVDAIFAPAIEEFQLALPAKTKLDVFEIWIKYNIDYSPRKETISLIGYLLPMARPRRSPCVQPKRLLMRRLWRPCAIWLRAFPSASPRFQKCEIGWIAFSTLCVAHEA